MGCAPGTSVRTYDNSADTWSNMCIFGITVYGVTHMSGIVTWTILYVIRVLVDGFWNFSGCLVMGDGVMGLGGGGLWGGNGLVGVVVGTVKFGNDQIAPILGYEDLVQGTITIKWVYYVEGLNHKLFSVGQFYDADLEVSFWKSTCYICDLKGNDLLTGSRGTDLYGENLDKMKEKGDAYIFVGYSTQSKAYRVFNKRTRMIVETIHVNFDELPQMASDHVSSDPDPQCSTTILKQDSLSPDPQRPENVPQVAETVTMSNELELLYSPMLSDILNGTSHVVSKSSAVHAADNPDKRQHHNTTHTSITTDVADPPPLNIHSTHQTPTQVPTVTAPENIIQAETNTENA
ncbi:hypothetical protein Tco_0637308 [Tanacetum coccineum]